MKFTTFLKRNYSEGHIAFVMDHYRDQPELINKYVSLYVKFHPIPEPATGSEWPTKREIDDHVTHLLLDDKLRLDYPFREGFHMCVDWLRDLMRSRLPVTQKVEWEELKPKFVKECFRTSKHGAYCVLSSVDEVFDWFKSAITTPPQTTKEK